ncbi:MAG: hypothetical protein PF495_09035 [Spirochaetales bacterium]|jgi:hypothetical protein|nr:hypothetical protein [Spirochaetales bacterium]
MSKKQEFKEEKARLKLDREDKKKLKELPKLGEELAELSAKYAKRILKGRNPLIVLHQVLENDSISAWEKVVVAAFLGEQKYKREEAEKQVRKVIDEQLQKGGIES